MGLFWESSSTGGERAANTNARSARERMQYDEHKRDTEWFRQQMRDFDFRNREHKRAVFETERALAIGQGRAPRYFSPEQVEDLPLPPHLMAPPAPAPGPGLPIAWRLMGFLIGALMLLGLIGSVAEAALNYLPGILQLVFWVAVGVTAVWLLLRFLAKGDPEKLARADKWSPVAIFRSGVAWVKQRRAARRGHEVE